MQEVADMLGWFFVFLDSCLLPLKALQNGEEATTMWRWLAGIIGRG